ncbi:hypothetical protein [Ectopseudomonas mendocina]|uniref:hypothetical protein n=1 Tax=Ectopseudomonas mendocina TaxID=300 RepID=UPI00376EF94C
MLDKEFHIRFTLADVGKALCFSPILVVLVYVLICLPWESSNAAAWVQAIGSVLAIVVAVVVALYSHEKELQRRREDAETADYAHAMRLHMLVGETIRATEDLLTRTQSKMTADIATEPFRPQGHEGEVNQQWIDVQGADIEFFQRIMQRAMLNLDDDQNAHRHVIAAKLRFNLSVLITLLTLSAGKNPTEDLESRIMKALAEFQSDREKLMKFFPRLVGKGFK